MTPEQKQRFKVITNPAYAENTTTTTKHKNEHSSYQTNPLTEKLMKFVNQEAGPRFTVEDLLKW